MPVEAYYQGHGRKVMAQMKRKHGEKAGKRIFYATANKRGQGPRGSGPFTPEELRRGYKVVNE